MRRTTSTSIVEPGRKGKEQPVYSTKQNTPQHTVHILTHVLTHTHTQNSSGNGDDDDDDDDDDNKNNDNDKDENNCNGDKAQKTSDVKMQQKKTMNRNKQQHKQ